ncbi:MAG: hypothetical protein JW982_09115 [Spirochaetes bacterium]|nr:hypothetical protein [Spirochaetota bacterium]
MLTKLFKYTIIVFAFYFCTILSTKTDIFQSRLTEYSEINAEKLEIIGSDQKENFRIQEQLLKAFIFINNYLASSDRYEINTTQLMNDHRKIVSSFEKHRVLKDELVNNNTAYYESSKNDLDNLQKTIALISKFLYAVLGIFIFLDVFDFILWLFKLRKFKKYDSDFKVRFIIFTPFYFFRYTGKIDTVIDGCRHEISGLHETVAKLTAKNEKLTARLKKNQTKPKTGNSKKTNE